MACGAAGQPQGVVVVVAGAVQERTCTAASNQRHLCCLHVYSKTMHHQAMEGPLTMRLRQCLLMHACDSCVAFRTVLL
jgi:hypothetical protein